MLYSSCFVFLILTFQLKSVLLFSKFIPPSWQLVLTYCCCLGLFLKFVLKLAVCLFYCCCFEVVFFNFFLPVCSFVLLYCCLLVFFLKNYILTIRSSYCCIVDILALFSKFARTWQLVLLYCYCLGVVFKINSQLVLLYVLNVGVCVFRCFLTTTGISVSDHTLHIDCGFNLQPSFNITTFKNIIRKVF